MKKNEGLGWSRRVAALVALTALAGVGACADDASPIDDEPLGSTVRGLGTEDLDGEWPPTPWVTPSLLVDGNFPSGVLSFPSLAAFKTFYVALDSATSPSASTGSQGTTAYAAASTADATTNTKTFTIALAAGQMLDLGTCDLEGSSFSGDTYLRLFVNGGEVAASDNACGGSGSRLAYTATAAVTAEVRMGCASSGSCSGTVGYSVLTPSQNGPAGGARSFTATNTASATTGFSQLVVHLNQGQVLDVGSCGVTGSAVTGDSYLRLIDADANVEVAASDDACGGSGSRITYTAPRDGLYAVRLGCYSAMTCSGTAAYTISADLTPAQMLPGSFSSAYDYLAARAPEPANDLIYDVAYSEYVDDLKEYLTEDETLRRLVDGELQIVIENRLYQLTNIGVFQVDMAAIPAYRSWLASNAYAINTNPSFNAIPGETSLGNGSYQVMPGVVRTVGNFGIPQVKYLAGDEDSGDSCPSCRVAPLDWGSAVPTAERALELGLTTQAVDPSTATSDFGDLVARRRRDVPIRQDVSFPSIAPLELGRVAYAASRRPLYKEAGGLWQRDCMSAALPDPLTHCQKFWPTTTSVTSVSVTTKPAYFWSSTSGVCKAALTGDGQQEWVCNGPSAPPPTCNQTPPTNLAYESVGTGSDFHKSEDTPFAGTNRRLVFKTRAPGFSTPNGGFNFVQIKAKIQRKKRFLGIGYWGPSNADEIVLTVENMKLDTNYVIPYILPYTVLSRPRFNKLADFELGGWVVKTANISFNMNLPFYPITQDDLASWGNSAFNSLIGSVFNDLWKVIERKIMDAIDSSFHARYAANARLIDAMNSQNKLRWALSNAVKPSCYGHKNQWTFGANGGFRYTENGGVPGPPGTPKAQINYKYSMKAGSFTARARLGSTWAAIRIVRTN